ncbi:hypothetical protein RIR_jg15049.t1 [Rhizophagus irregularis DAOM 181602=DAOM 197198]|nr:hypothetical protein RIR_jg15049.t1 [Rhizophagus irregularis DAOM 181602=DAOM 197198]
MSGHSDHSSSSDDAISENNEYDKKCRKLDYLIDSADDGSGGEVRRACQISAETPEFNLRYRTYSFIWMTDESYSQAFNLVLINTNRIINCGKKDYCRVTIILYHLIRNSSYYMRNRADRLSQEKYRTYLILIGHVAKIIDEFEEENFKL